MPFDCLGRFKIGVSKPVVQGVRCTNASDVPEAEIHRY